MITIKKLIQDPLIHFLAMGVVLYSLVDVFSVNEDAPGGNTIKINQESMVRFLQFQNKAFNGEKALGKWQSMSMLEKENLSEDYIREEVMYREALNLGLDVDDQIIRRRLIQKIEFINMGFQSDMAKINETDLNEYFKQHIIDYKIDAAITFSHVFFENSKSNKDSLSLAQDTLINLNGQNIPFENAAQYGQRFFYHRNYVDRTPAFVASHFGDSFSKGVFNVLPDGQWHGPIKSKYGHHLIIVTKNQAARLPALKEVAGQVLESLQRIKQSQVKKEALTALVAKYKVINHLKGQLKSQQNLSVNSENTVQLNANIN